MHFNDHFTISFKVQTTTIENIGKKDVIWSYIATFLQIGSGVLLFPFILHMLPSETVGIWSIFLAIAALVNLIDFGFNPSFTRNVTYIFSGVSQLEKQGISEQTTLGKINYILLGSTIRAMKWLYSRMALIALLILITAGSAYLYYVIQKGYQGNVQQIAIAWVLFCFVNTYNIYTLYYDALLMGKGLVKTSKQITIISQVTYLLISIILVYYGLGLIAIVLGQAFSLIIRRILSYRSFFTPILNQYLNGIDTGSFKEIVKTILPNSAKLGLTSIGAFLVLQSATIIGSLFLSLEDVASYGITLQVVNVIASLSGVYYFSYVPKISQLRVENNKAAIKQIYLKSVGLMFATFAVCGVALIFGGNWGLSVLKSQTMLLGNSMMIVMLIIACLEKNHAIAGGFLVSKNEVPYFKAALISGGLTVILLLIFIKYAQWGLWGMIVAPGLVQLAYQNWKWPTMVIKDLKSTN
ncbi:MAG: O-unit flippase-like protein [Paludibacteraceae bacterium]|nr:O-unit flippase-like protein [Paludibacteraceae bacterium]